MIEGEAWVVDVVVHSMVCCAADKQGEQETKR